MENDYSHSKVVIIDANTHRPLAKLLLNEIAIIGYQVNGIGKPQGKPDMIDTTSSTVIYEGYLVNQELFVCKIDMTTAVIMRSWSIGAWADRATLIYSQS